MTYWLMKTEPDTFSWDDQVKRGAKGEPWTGVRNFRARAHLKAMKKGDLAFFYHTGAEKQVVGIVEVIREAYPDPTDRSEEHTSELQSHLNLVCRLLLEKKKTNITQNEANMSVAEH